uniref:Suf domain-containing protein n=1 Tax=Gongylonema pulchrum TaxID=637853 RepID=A0A183DWR4_9BILA
LPPVELIRLLPPLSPMYPLVTSGMQRPARPGAPAHGFFPNSFGNQRQVHDSATV